MLGRSIAESELFIIIKILNVSVGEYYFTFIISRKLNYSGFFRVDYGMDLLRQLKSYAFVINFALRI